jgi:hypothetical protein
VIKRNKKLPKLAKGAWFYKVRGSYLPATWQGWLTYIPFTAFLLWVMVWAITNENNVAQAVLVVFPAWMAAGVVMTWLAARKS